MTSKLNYARRRLWIAAARPAFWRVLAVGLLVALTVLGSASPASAQTPTPTSGGGGGGLGGVTASLANMAKIFIDFLIGVAAILLAVGFATGFVQGQVSTMFGMPHALASTWMRLAGVLICFIGALLAIPFANAIIDAMSNFSGSEGIHLPGGGA